MPGQLYNCNVDIRITLEPQRQYKVQIGNKRMTQG